MKISTVYAHKLTKAEAQIDWTQPAADIDRNIRAFNPWPVAFTPLDDGNNLRIWNSSLSTQKASNALPSEVIALDQDWRACDVGDQTCYLHHQSAMARWQSPECCSN